MGENKLDKPGIVLRALIQGMEVELDGRTYVWLDNFPTQVIGGQQYGIDGLAIKGESFKAGQPIEEGKGEPHYMGSDMSFTRFVKLCESMPDLDAFDLAGTMALRNMAKKRG